MIQAKNSIKGKINTPQKINTKLNASIIYVEPELEELEVMPSREEQHFVSEKDGYSSVTVKGDENLTPNNILKDKEIFGVVGELDVIDTSDATAIPENITVGKTAYVKNEKITGTLRVPTNGLIIHECDEDGFPIDMSIIGMTEIPQMFCTGSNGYSAFAKCITINLPDELVTIGPYAFTYCTYWVLKKLPNGVKKIEANAFEYCYNLALTELPSNITSIGNYAFRDCSRLALTELPSGITTIGTYAFRGCKNITELTLNGNITNIYANAFAYSSNLQKFVMPNITSVPSLANKNAFTNTPIANGTGYIYVPDNLVDSFKSATNWSTYADQIKGVSELV